MHFFHFLASKIPFFSFPQKSLLFFVCIRLPAVEKLTKKAGDHPMKILLLTDRLDVGGAETHIALLAQELLRAGNTLAVASSGGAIADRLESQGIAHFHMPLSTHSPIRWLILRHKIRELIRQEGFEVAHAHARVPALLIHGVRRLGCAEIVTVHAKFRSGFLRRICSRWGEYSIAVSEDLRAYLHKVYQIPMQRISVIPNGIDLFRFAIDAEKEPPNPLRILFASRLDRDCSRGAELLCEIAPLLASTHPDLRITIAGGGEKMREIATRAAKINQTLGFSCISVVGTVQDMPSLLREQDIFVGVSRAALEAAAGGCTVILCGNEGYGGILKEETFWQASLSNFCARGEQNPTAQILQEDILALASSPALQKRYTEECRALLEAWYDSKTVCQQTLAVYQKNLHIFPRATVAIGGYFGCGNFGDDAILQAFVEYTRTHYPDMRILALTKRPRKNARQFGVSCYNRKNPFSIIRAFLRADAFLCGGGSLLQNCTGRLSLHYYLCMLRLARMCNALPVLYAAGIGPLRGKYAHHITKKTLSRCNYISLRDEDSLRFLRTQNIDSAKLHLGADVALLLPVPPIFRTYATLKRIDVVQNCRYACICLKAGKHTSQSLGTLIAALRMLCRKEKLLPIFLPLDRTDIRINEEAALHLCGKCFYADEASDITAILRGAAFLVSMRLHGLILATTVSLPSLGIPSADDQKIPSFCRLAAQEYLLPENLSVTSLVQICQHFCTHGDALRPLIADACRDLQKNAQKDLANIAAMVYNRGRYFEKSEDTI